MTIIELKKVLIHRIAEINDISFLKAIKTILDSKTEAEILSLTAEQRSEIKKSEEEIEKGQFIEQDLLDKKVTSWLNSR